MAGRVRRVKGGGSFYVDATGAHVFAIVVTLSDGRRRRFVRKGMTLREVQVKAKELRRTLDAGVMPTHDTVGEWLAYWRGHIAGPKLKASTLAGYDSKLERYIVPKLGEKRLSRLTSDDVRELHEWMADKGLAPATIRQAHAILSAALKVAEDEGKIVRNPCRSRAAQPPTVTPHPHPILSAADAAKVLAAVKDIPQLRARVAVAILTGLRQGEALALKWDDVHEGDARPTLRVRQSMARKRGGGLVVGTPKSRRSAREVPLDGLVTDALSKWREVSGGAGYVFASPAGAGILRDPRRDSLDWSMALEMAGVDHVPLHGARGTLATILMARGVPDRVIADMLGHDVMVDQKHYQHSDDEQRREGAKVAAEAIEAAARA